MQNIKHIIFDLGEVIINVNPAAVKEYMSKKGVGNMDELHLKLLEGDIYHQLETGKIKPEDFRAAIKKIIDVEVTDEEIDIYMVFLSYPLVSLNDLLNNKLVFCQ